MDVNQWILGHPSYVTHADDPAWQDRRSEVITGSEVASLMGLNPWRGREALLESYLRPSPWHDNHKTFWGRQLESAVLDGYGKLTGLRVVNTNAFFIRDGIGATIDGLIDPDSFESLLPASEGYVGTTAPSYWRKTHEQLCYLLGRDKPVICECKVTSERNKADWGKEVPAYYVAQLQAQMWATDLDVSVIVAKIGAYDIRHHVVERDEPFQLRMVEEAERFMEEIDVARSF